MIGELLDKIPEWIDFIIAGILVLYFIQILAGLFLMSEHLHYPKVKINDQEDQWTPIIWLPLRLYYVWFFTNKFNYKE